MFFSSNRPFFAKFLDNILLSRWLKIPLSKRTNKTTLASKVAIIALLNEEESEVDLPF